MRKSIEAHSHVENRDFDVCVIGGGATGAGCALDAQLRGLRTVLLEAFDFGSASSSASTKLIHGGVRYLQEAVEDLDPQQYHLVDDALRERAGMMANAPFLSRPLEFLVPTFSRYEQLYYGLGMKMYDLIARRASLFPTLLLSRDEALARMPGLRREGLHGAVSYADGQFDDARYNLTVIESFAMAGGEPLNYAQAVEFERDGSGRLRSALVEDRRDGHRFRVTARVFVNATGPVSDVIRQMANHTAPARMRPSKGVHILLPLDGFPEGTALLVPKTEDGRVIFAVPWQGRLLVGTTDTEWKPGEPLEVTAEEIEYLLRQLNPYLQTPRRREQVVSAYAGIRPLVAASDAVDTKKLIRDDEVEYDAASGLVSILGGKWTTFRLMAERTINKVQEVLGGPVTECRTRNHLLAGAEEYTGGYWRSLQAGYGVTEETARYLARKYGTRAAEVLDLAEEDPSLRLPLVDGLPIVRAQVVYGVQREMAHTLEDVLSRRIGVQFFGWRLAQEAAAIAGGLMERELGSGAAGRVEEYVAMLEHRMETAGLREAVTERR